MKQFITLILAILFFSLSQAQEKCRKDAMHPGNPRGQHQNNPNRQRKIKMMQALGLSEEQKSKMKSIHDEARNKMEALNQQQTISVKEYNDKKSAIRKEMQAKREAILTKEQKDKIASMKAEREARKNEMYEKKMAKMKETANLTDEQTKQMNALRKKTKDDVENIKNNPKLNDQEKRTQIKALIKNSRDSRLNMLTKEQLIKMLEARNKKNTKDKSAIKK